MTRSSDFLFVAWRVGTQEKVEVDSYNRVLSQGLGDLATLSL